jgi:hypothetical protein
MQKRREYNRRLDELFDRQALDYYVKVDRLNDPAEPDSFYWHLYYRDAKINGGMTDDRKEARRMANWHMWRHTRDFVMASYVWDCESGTWIPRAELNIG